MIRRFSVLSIIVVVTLLGFGSVATPFADAQTSPAEIERQMAEIRERQQRLEAEIAESQRQLDVLSGQKRTLQTAIREIDVARSKLTSQITLTESRIRGANLTLEQLAYDMRDKEELIQLNRQAVGESIRTLDSADDSTMVEQFLAADSLAEAWRAADEIAMVNSALRANVVELGQAKDKLKEQQQQVESTRKDLSALNSELSGQKQGLDANRQAQAQLLAQTQNQESTYQSLIAQKRAQQKAFESELSQLEESLKIAVDPSHLPTAGDGVLKYPFTPTFMAGCSTRSGVLGNPFCITQYFGNTPFSTSNPQIYNGAGHNAVDFGAPTGTPVTAALSGTVLGTGNTDAVPGCYSFGKWVVVKHGNGLATLYAHLSSIQVSAGQGVATGQTLGFSGMTGYATGPHLHFGVYASEGIKIMDLGAWRRQNGQAAGTGCAAGGAIIPVASPEAYLNPMSYF